MRRKSDSGPENARSKDRTKQNHSIPETEHKLEEDGTAQNNYVWDANDHTNEDIQLKSMVVADAESFQYIVCWDSSELARERNMLSDGTDTNQKWES